jgi:hypothetical protein
MTEGERRRPTDAERAAYVATLTPEQKQKYEKVTAEFRARMAQGGGPGGPGGQGFGGPGGGSGGAGFGGGPGGGGGPRPRPESAEPRTATVYLKEKAAADAPSQVVLRAVTVKLGIGDASNVEVLEGLGENDLVVSGTSTAAVAAMPRNPLSNPFGGPRPR